MADTTNPLHLPDLTITGFRGIDALSIPRLGRVTLLVGKNGIGKTTVLDAVKIYAARGRYKSLEDALVGHEEVIAAIDEGGETRVVPDWGALFHGRDLAPEVSFSVGPEEGEERLSISAVDVEYPDVTRLWGRPADQVLVLLAVVEARMRLHRPTILATDSLARTVLTVAPDGPDTIDVPPLNSGELPPAMKCVALTPGPMDKDMFMRMWDTVALTDDEDVAVDAVSLVLNLDVQRVAVLREDNANGGRAQSGPRAMVKLRSHRRAVPLNSLGGGATRLFEVALALANARNGFLLVDEAENGIHFSLQRNFWNMVLTTARRYDIQVIATTHSWDCVTGFAQAASEYDEAEGVLVRLSRQYGSLRAVEYSEKDLRVAAEQRIEVR